MKLRWYILNDRGSKDEGHLRRRVRRCARHINETCLTYICDSDGETTAEIQNRPRYDVDDLKYILKLRDIESLFITIYKQLLCLQRIGEFVVTPSSISAIDVKWVDGNTFLLGVPVIDKHLALELR